MGDRFKELVGVAFALPEVGAVFGVLFGAFWVEICDEFEHDNLTNLKFKRLAGQKDLVVGDVGQ